MMVFKKRARVLRRSQQKDQIAGNASGSAILPSSTPDQPIAQQMTVADGKRFQKRPKKMCALRRAIRAVFCAKRTETDDQPVATPDETGGNEESTPESPGTKAASEVSGPELSTVCIQDTEQHQTTIDTQPTSQSRTEAQVSSSMGQSEETPEKKSSKDNDEPKRASVSLSSVSLHTLSQMTSQQLASYLMKSLCPPAEEEPKSYIEQDAIKVSTASKSASSSGVPDVCCSTAPLVQETEACPSEPKEVYHPHLGCRMYNRNDIKPVVVDELGHHRGMVGEGAFARVTVVHLPDSSLAAAKVLQEADSEGPLWQEIIAATAVGDHPSFPRLYGVVQQKPLRTMLYEFIGDKDDLSVTTLQDGLDWSGTSQALSRKDWMRVVCNICEGLLYLHSIDYVHCDIKSDNILLYRAQEGNKTRWQAKIVDLGNTCPEVAGPWLRLPKKLVIPMYSECPQIAPEVLEGDSHFNKPAEVFALGDLFLDIGRAAGIRRLRGISKKCLDYDYRKRPTMAQICKYLAKYWK